MEYNFADTEVFVPESMGNSKADTPARFYIHALTISERNRLTRMEVDDQGNMRAIPDLRGYFLAGCDRIEDLRVNGKAITKPADFMQQKKLYSMFAEVAARVISFSQPDDEEDSKN